MLSPTTLRLGPSCAIESLGPKGLFKLVFYLQCAQGIGPGDIWLDLRALDESSFFFTPEIAEAISGNSITVLALVDNERLESVCHFAAGLNRKAAGSNVKRSKVVFLSRL